MAGSTRGWGDRDLDHGGRPTRPDVRSAGHEIWEQACRRTRAVVSDQTPAGGTDGKRSCTGIPVPGPHRSAPVISKARSADDGPLPQSRALCFKIGSSGACGTSTELRTRTAEERWVAQSNARLDLEIILRRLSGRNA